MDNASTARQAVKKVYDNPTWAKRVDRMSDLQVVAIFMRLRLEGKL